MMKKLMFIFSAGLLAMNVPARCVSPYLAGAAAGTCGAVPCAAFGSFLGALSQTEGPREPKLAFAIPVVASTVGGIVMGGLGGVVPGGVRQMLKSAVGGGVSGLGIGMVAGACVYSMVKTPDAKK